MQIVKLKAYLIYSIYSIIYYIFIRFDERRTMIEFKRKCPYCGKLMEKGKIPPRNYTLKWKSEDGNRSGLNYLFNLDKKDIILASVWNNIYCTGYLCRRCKKIIIDI